MASAIIITNVPLKILIRYERSPTVQWGTTTPLYMMFQIKFKG